MIEKPNKNIENFKTQGMNHVFFRKDVVFCSYTDD